MFKCTKLIKLDLGNWFFKYYICWLLKTTLNIVCVTSTDINECLINNPCLNDAVCENTPGSYICRCKPGYEGDLCQYSE